jgi:ribokinase
MQKTGVVVVGSHVQGLFMNVSRFPGPDETVLGWDFKEALDGGKGSHQAIACSRLGLPTHFVGRIGHDRLGEIGASWMTDAGVDLTYLARSERTATGCGFVMVNPQGIPAITTAMGANAEFSPDDVERAESVFAQAKLALITLEIPLSSALYAARLAKKHGAYTILTPGPAESVAPNGFADIDLLMPNENEASTLLGVPAKAHDPSWLADQLQRHFGLKQIVITLGENGVLIADGDKRHTVPAFKVPVVETPGAGDCFTAGLAFGFYHETSLVDAASFGCLAAARSVSIPGSIPGFGTLKEIAEFATANHLDLPAALHAMVNLAVH